MATNISAIAQEVIAAGRRITEGEVPLGRLIREGKEPMSGRARYEYAAVIRAVVDQVVPSDAVEPRNYLPMAIECQRIREELLAIADELEGVTYGTYRCSLERK